MQHISITNSTNLDEKEVERMRKEAEAHAAEDAEKKSKIEAKNQADSLIFTAEKTLKDTGDKAPADLKKEVEDKVAALKAILESGTKEDLEAKSKDLMDSLQKLGAEMYKQTPPPTEEKPTEEKPADAKKAEEGEVVN